MSHENVEIVRRFIDRFNDTGEFVWEQMGPDVVWVVDPPAFLVLTLRGGKLAAYRAYFDRALALEAVGLRE